MVTCRSRHAVGLVEPVEDHSNTINTMAAVFTNFLKRGRRIPRFHLLDLLGILATTPQSADATQASRSSARTSSRIILKRIFGVRQKGVLGVLASKGGTGVHTAKNSKRYEKQQENQKSPGTRKKTECVSLTVPRL